MQNEIVNAIAAYLENQRWSWQLPLGNYETAAEIAAAIAPLVEGEVDWQNAPHWAQWRTVDKHGAVLYWENEPIPDDENGFWVRRINDADGDFKYGNHLIDWKIYKQRRP